MEKMSFEEALVSLEKIVKELENGSIDLDQAIEKYSIAMKLAKDCDERLKKATEQVNKILAENGNLEDFDLQKEDNQ